MRHKAYPLYHSILPSGLAVAFALASLALGLAFGQKALGWIGIFSLILVAGSKAWASEGGKGLKLQLGLDRSHVFPGETVKLRLSLENRSMLPVRARVRAELPAGASAGELSPEGADHSSGLFDRRVGAKGRATKILELRPEKRGVFVFGELGLAARDPFGFFEHRSRVLAGEDIVVFPRVFALDRESFPALGFFGATASASSLEDPAYAAGIRDHRGERPARYIHWKASARRGKLQEKVFEATARREICLIVDTGSFESGAPESKGAEEEFEIALEVAASIAFLYMAGGANVGYVGNGVCAGGKPGIVGSGGILDTLARLQMRSDGDIAELAGRAFGTRRYPSAVYFGRDFGESALRLKRTLSRIHDLGLWFVLTGGSPGSLPPPSSRTLRPGDLRPEWRRAHD
jgi:uncharacterized protein (DUF58 family)